MRHLILFVMIFSLIGCTTVGREIENNETADIISETIEAGRSQLPVRPAMTEPAIPDYVPIKEETSPLAKKTVSLSARGTPLRDILYTIAETANLNLVMEKGVDPELPITITFEDIVIEEALKIIFDSMDYFYSIKDNILVVKAMDTEIFELGKPNVIHEYKADVGGDIISGVASSGEGDSSNLRGDVTMVSTSDEASFRFWESIEDSLASLLRISASAEGDQDQANLVINRMTGTIMVTASKRDLNNVRNYIDNLKKILNRQVIIEARIVEVQLSDSLKYGINWIAVGEWLGVGTNTLGTRLFADVVTTTAPNFEFSVTDNDNLSLVLRALEEQGDVKTLSNPRVNIINGQTAMLSVGRSTSFIARVETTTTVSEGSAPITTFTVDTNSILSGIMFGLVPYINSDNEITLTITPIISDLVSLDSELIGSGSSSIELQLPTVDLREMSTTIKVLDGQLIIIGGLIDKKEKLTEDKVPILSDIPIIGEAFKSVDKSYENKELVIMLIPRIVS